MAKRTTHLVAALVAVTAAACASAPSRFYILESTARSTEAPAGRQVVLVGPVSIPASVDRPQFVVQTAPNRVEIDEFNRWAAPLDDAIARAVAGDLSVLLGTQDVAIAPLANYKATHRVIIDVQRFESVQGDAAVLDAVWTVQPAAGGEPRAGRTVARETAGGPGFDALAAAHSRALSQLSTDIAAAILAGP